MTLDRAGVLRAGQRAIVLAILAIGVVVCLIPLYVMCLMAFKSASEGATTSVWELPKHPTTENFVKVLHDPLVVFVLLLKNTFVIAAIKTFGVVFTSALTAYPFARMRFAGRDRLFILLLSTLMLPGIVTMIPTYVMYTRLHWIDTILPLTVSAYFGGGAFNIFLLRQFFGTIPRELDEAAVLDGASHWTIFRRILIPLSGAALATVGFFTFSGAWSDFMGPLLYINDNAKQTLEVGLSTYNSLYDKEWHLLMAASLLVMLPLVLIFLVGQRAFVKGIVMTGLK